MVLETQLCWNLTRLYVATLCCLLQRFFLFNLQVFVVTLSAYGQVILQAQPTWFRLGKDPGLKNLCCCHKHCWKFCQGLLKNIWWCHDYKSCNTVVNFGHWFGNVLMKFRSYTWRVNVTPGLWLTQMLTCQRCMKPKPTLYPGQWGDNNPKWKKTSF